MNDANRMFTKSTMQLHYGSLAHAIHMWEGMSLMSEMHLGHVLRTQAVKANAASNITAVILSLSGVQ